MTDFAERIRREQLGLDKPLPEDQPKPKKARPTMDELLDIASDIAQDPESGPDRFRAIRMLTQIQVANVMLTEPMGDGDIVDRLSRLMKGAGQGLTQIAYNRAFPSAKLTHAHNIATAYADATPEQVAQSKRTTSLKLLYKHFPEVKRQGIPKGFPSGRSIAAKTEFCQNQALKLLVERETKARQGAHQAMTANDQLIRGATDGSAPA